MQYQFFVKVPIQLKPSVITEIRKMEREGMLKPVLEDGSAWASPIVVVKNRMVISVFLPISKRVLILIYIYIYI